MQLQLGLGILSFYVVAATPALAGHWTAPPAPTAELTSPATTPAPSGAEKRDFFSPYSFCSSLKSWQVIGTWANSGESERGGEEKD